METTLHEPEIDCQREVLRALVDLAEGNGTYQATGVETPLSGRLTENQWDQCWWNVRLWARKEQPATYELFRLAGKGSPIAIKEDGSARMILDVSFPARAQAALDQPSSDVSTIPSRPTPQTQEKESHMYESSTLRARAIRFEQNGRVFYTTVVPAHEIINRSRVDVWSADVAPEDAGYQRAPMPTRLRDMANYIEQPDAVLPLGGLLNARAESDSAYGEVLSFEADDLPETLGTQSGWLTIPSAAVPLFIVDMQHRLLGIKRAIEEDGRDDLGSFPVVLTIADGLSKLEEIQQFELINTAQKKVSTDLARRLMSIQMTDPDLALKFDQRGKRWEARGPMIADWLNHNSDIWRDAIMPPNKTKKMMPTALTKETSFVTSLKPVLQTPLFQRTEDEQVAILVDRYWHAVRAIWPDAFAAPQDSVIHRTSGVFSLHQLMPEVFELARANGQTPTAERMTQVIENWRKLGSDYWSRDREHGGAARYGTSMGAFSRLAAELRAELPDLDLGL